MLIDQVVVRQVAFPLIQPYKLSNGSKKVFEPFVVEIVAEGRRGWGECMVSEGYTTETREDSWKAALVIAERIRGIDAVGAATVVDGFVGGLPGICSALYGALDMVSDHPLLARATDTRVPILAPCQQSDRSALRDEIEQILEQGYETLKVKVGFDWRSDLDRVAMIQDIVANRALIRLDANRGFDLASGLSFARHLQPRSIELFEQPCGADDWEFNAEVARVCTVPVMLDESIYGLEAVERAATMSNVGFVKLKLKKMGRLDTLVASLRRIRELGMTPVLGDGVSLELACWMEACVAVQTIDNAGEMNGFLKARERLLENPLQVDRGCIFLPAGYTPVVDRQSLEKHTLRSARF